MLLLPGHGAARAQRYVNDTLRLLGLHHRPQHLLFAPAASATRVRRLLVPTTLIRRNLPSENARVASWDAFESRSLHTHASHLTISPTCTPAGLPSGLLAQVLLLLERHSKYFRACHHRKRLCIANGHRTTH